MGTYFRFSISVREWIGAAAIALGLAGFLYFAAPGGGNEVPVPTWVAVDRWPSRGFIAAAVVATRWGPRWWKAAMFGTAAAIAFAFTAALIKVVERLRGQRLGARCSATGRPTG